MVAEFEELPLHNVYLVVRRKPLSDVPLLYRWLARWVYFRIGWASDYSVEYQGVFETEAEARHAASGPGMSYSMVPLNGILPLDTAQYGTHDFPHSEASIAYRRRTLPLKVVPTLAPSKALTDLLAIEERLTTVQRRIENPCIKAN